VARSQKIRAEDSRYNGGLQEESRTQEGLLWKDCKLLFDFPVCVV